MTLSDDSLREACNALNRRTEFRVLRTTYGLFDNVKPQSTDAPAEEQNRDAEDDKKPEGATTDEKPKEVTTNDDDFLW